MMQRIKNLLNTTKEVSDKQNTNIIITFIDMLITRIIVGAAFCEYREYQLFDIPMKVRKTYFVKRQQLKLLKKYNRKGYKLYSNKRDIESFVTPYFNRDVCYLEDISFDNFLKFCTNKKSIMYKPIDSSSGRGIIKYETPADRNQLRKIYDEMKSKGNGIIEEIIEQCEEMNKIFPYCVNTVRVVTVNDGTCEIVWAALRMGVDVKSPVDNLSHGGIAAVVNVEDGTLLTDAADEKGNRYISHPTTGVRFSEFQIPQWDKILELMESVYDKIPEINYIGWDIAVGVEKPMIVEANILYPGNALLQLPFVSQKQGTKYIIEKYL